MAPFIFTLYQLFLLYTLSMLYSLNFFKQANRTDVLKARYRDVPAAGAGRLPAHLQGDVMPAIREQGREPLAGLDAPALQEQPRVRTGIYRVW